MKRIGKLAIGALMAGAAALAIATPAAARTYVGISFGFGMPGYASFGPCDYYDYYDAAPPWGLPPNYCDYNVYFEPIYWDGEWYRGPVYYRWEDGRRVFWLNGRWRNAEWRRRPYNIEWRERGRDHFHRYYGRHRGHEHGGYYHDRYRPEHGGYYHHEGGYYEHSGYRNENYQGRHHDHEDYNRGYQHTRFEHTQGSQNYQHGDRHNEHGARNKNHDDHHGHDHDHDQNGHS